MAEADATQPASPSEAPSGGIRNAPLHRVWVIKVTVILLVLVAFGGWGLYDATVLYPARGERYAEWAEWQYLETLNQAGNEEFGIFTREASVVDPVSTLTSLEDPEVQSRLRQSANDPSSTNHLRATARLARMAWLDGLDTIGELSPERTQIESPRARLTELQTIWSEQSAPKPLAFYDIPSQWIMMGVAWAFAAYILYLILKTITKTYRWDDAEQRLYVARDVSLVPDDLAEVDKRKWDKFIVVLRIREEHPALGGQALKLDTYRHAELEGWILQMEEAKFGPQEDADDAAASNSVDDAHDAEQPDSGDADGDQVAEDGADPDDTSDRS